jgi:hypothetical protein
MTCPGAALSPSSTQDCACAGLSLDPGEWFPAPAAAAGPGDEDDDDTDGSVGNIDPDEDEGYDDDEEDDDEDTLWAEGAPSSSPPNRE